MSDERVKTGVERMRQRRAARDASGVLYVDGSIYEGMAACLVRNGRTVAHVVKYDDAVEIAAAVAATPATPAPSIATGSDERAREVGIHETMRLVEYDMTNRRRDGDGFVGERKEVAAIITALRAALAASRPTDAGADEWTFTPDDREKTAILDLCADQELSPTAVMRQALRLYQADHLRRKNGETVTWSGDEQRARDFAGPLATPKPPVDEARRQCTPALAEAKEAMRLGQDRREAIVSRAVDQIMNGFSFSTLTGPDNLRARLSLCARQAVDDTAAAIRNLTGDGAGA